MNSNLCCKLVKKKYKKENMKSVGKINENKCKYKDYVLVLLTSKYFNVCRVCIFVYDKSKEKIPTL